MAEYNFINVIADHTISVTFTNQTFIITASAGVNGTISPSGAVVVNYGANQAFTFTPDTGYEVDEIQVDGVPV